MDEPEKKERIGMSTYGSLLSISVQRPPREHRWGSFVAGYIVQATAITALLFYTVTTPTILRTQVEHVELLANGITAPKVAQIKAKSRSVSRIVPAPVAMPKITVPKIIASPVLQAQQPQRVHRIAEVAEVAQPQFAAPKLDARILNVSPGPKAASRIIATNTFGENSTSPSPQKIAPTRVQTVGFGDPNGVQASTHTGNRATTAAPVAFDLPSGRGSGESPLARATIVTAGFGNGPTTQGGGERVKGRVQSTNFITAPTAYKEALSSKVANHKAASAPVSIQSKPTPVYTSEARQLRVEGEVLLRVVFTAEGQIRILNVVRGLGHGLDEAAQRAAQGVRFSPAMRDGHPVDSNVTLHIVFQLS